MLVILFERRGDGESLDQPPRDAGVFAGDDIDTCERLQRAQGDVAEVADRSRNQIESGRGLGRADEVSCDRKGAGGAVGIGR